MADGLKHKARTGLLLLLCLTASAEAGETTNEPHYDFDIPRQRAALALTEFAEQADLTLIVSHDLVEGIVANELIGRYSLDEGATILLRGTGLSPTFSNHVVLSISADPISVEEGGSMEIKKKAGVLAAIASIFTGELSAEEPDASITKDDQVPLEIEEIVVTGTSIRGIIPESSPLEVYDAIDIRNTGAVTAEAFISALTQNNNTLTAIGVGASSRQSNTTEINSADLRGLGVGTTLILLNGRRMAPALAGRTADLSFIPLAAVERVEVLTDGASAIYGADAVGGVINFVLKDKQDGAESTIGFGAVDGGREQIRASQSFGFNWDDGNAFIALSLLDQGDLDASDRDYSRAAAPRTLVGEDTRANVLASATQELSGKFSISADLLYSTREPKNSGNGVVTSQFFERDVESTQTVLNFAVERPIGDTLTAEFLLTHADYEQEAEVLRFDAGVPGSGPQISDQESTVLDATAKLSGDLLRLQNGTISFSLGTGYTEDELDLLSDTSLSIPGSQPTLSELSRNTKYAFAELFVPIISPRQTIPGMRRLELSLATRYTEYSDFGDDNSPKIGLLWSPAESLNIRSTFGTSFRAPFLVQLVPGGNAQLFPVGLIGLPDVWGAQDGSSQLLFVDGSSNPELGPEEAETFSFGFDYDRAGLELSATYFSIDYTDRVASPDPSGGFSVLSSPQEFPSFFDVDPTVGQVAGVLAVADTFLDASVGGCFCILDPSSVDPAAVQAATTVLFDNRLQNQAISETNGFDLAVSYTMKFLGGDLSFGAHATRTFEYEQRAFANASAISLVDTVLFPADLKARTHIGLQREKWSARLNVNYVDEYQNPFDEENPTVDSWTTADLLFFYEAPAEASGILNGVRVSFTVSNILDEDPPFVAPQVVSNTSIQFPIGFDPANANPFGRSIDIQISKRW